ncbi:segregation/condensation protein A [Candidatus Woesearchaeota archaeon]|nr:segregation/condensation protein A [Candidatus Woesearchaeota archaeon]
MSPAQHAQQLPQIKKPQEHIFNMLLKKDEITWQTIIQDLVKNEQMDPWDVDVSVLTQRFLQTLKKLKEMDFRISGKIVLASAILVKVKSVHFMDKDISYLDALFASSEEQEEDMGFDDDILPEAGAAPFERPALLPRTPQPRTRKVSLQDLMQALEQALEVNRRRNLRLLASVPVMEMPKKTVDMSQIIMKLYGNIKQYFGANKALTFSQLVPSDSKEDKVLTFIPLLHLTNQRKINLEQKEHFGEIDIYLLKNKEVDQELGIV